MASPLKPSYSPILHPLDGMAIYVGQSNIKYKNRLDILVMLFDELRPIALAATKSDTASAAVEWCRKASNNDAYIKALIVNAGNANAFTGKAGYALTQHNGDFLATQYNCSTHHIYQASTGVIGEKLPHDILSKACASLREGSWDDASHAIMTTDTYSKKSHAILHWCGRDYPMHAVSKGSGMIAPNMATMLSFIVTNAPIPAVLLQQTLLAVIPLTYNAITVDSDTSTSDTVLCVGGVEDSTITISDHDKQALYDCLYAITHDAAMQIVRDGEGAQKLITVRVKQAFTDDAAKKIAFSIANSPLVKTAIAGEDANWGRIIMAIGKAEQHINQHDIKIFFGDILVAEHGEAALNYNEDDLAIMLREPYIDITVSLQAGHGTFTAYTCDLTHDYIAINADYRS